VGGVLTVAAAAAYVRLHGPGFDPLGLDRLLGWGPQDWALWESRYFDKSELDPARIVTMVSVTAALYVALRRYAGLAERTLGRLLLPLGRNSFYVFIMHVFVALAVASVPVLAGSGLGSWPNALVQIGFLALLWAMVRHRFLFRYVPR